METLTFANTPQKLTMKRMDFTTFFLQNSMVVFTLSVRFI